MIKKLLYDTDTLIFTTVSISLNNLHEIVSIVAISLSIIYTGIKIKKDFFNKWDQLGQFGFTHTS
jgi:hypothetical protein